MPFNQGHGGVHQEWGQQGSSSITRCVNYIYEGASNLISAMSTSLSFSTTLAGSGQPPRGVLNPNAKSFTPLNPNAKEFHPSSDRPTPLISEPKERQNSNSDPEPKERENSNSNSNSNEKEGSSSSSTVTPPNGLLQVEEQDNYLQITPEMKCEMKNIAYRKCTPWIPKISVKSKDHQEKQQQNIREIIPPSDISFSEDDHQDLEDSDDDDDDDSEVEDDGIVSKRSRILSQCSSESGSFIQFGNSEESPRNCSKNSPRIPEKPSPFLANFLCGNESDDDDDDEDEEDSSEDEDDDDSDHFGSWDSSIDAIVLDDPDILAEFGLQCQWQIPSSKVVNKSVDTVDNHQKKNTEFEVFFDDLDQEENSTDFLLLDEFHLSRNAKNDHNETLKQIQAANERWSEINNSSENGKQTADDADYDVESSIIEEERKTKVTFAEPL